MRVRPFRSSAVLALTFVLLGGTLALAQEDAAPEPGAQALGPVTRTIALGVSMPDGRDLSVLDAFTSAVGGRVPATWTIWSQWGRRDFSAFPATAAEGARARGAMPMIWWEPVDPSRLDDPTYPRLANITAGLHDDYIRSFARQARQFRHPVLLRFAHEMNGGMFPWGVQYFDNSAATFVAAWRHVHRIFQQVGATNVRFVWSVAKKSCAGGCDPYAQFYPGDAYVDYLGFSSYNWGAFKEGWVSMLQGYTRVTNLLASLSSKPIMAVETGANPEGGDKAAWIREGYLAVYERLPRVEAIVYLNVDLRPDGHPDWSLTSPPEALEMYASIASMPEFWGRIPGD
jgi:hypothetical protein